MKEEWYSLEMEHRTVAYHLSASILQEVDVVSPTYRRDLTDLEIHIGVLQISSQVEPSKKLHGIIHKTTISMRY
jgi:hypothetical protein